MILFKKYLPILFLIAINLTANKIDFKFDLTDDKKYTISEKSKNILNNVNDKLLIKVYLKGSLPSGFNLLSYSAENLLKSFNKINNNITFEFINPDLYNNDQQNIFKQLQEQGLFPTDLKIKKQSETTSKIIFPGAIIYYKERRTAINFLENRIGVSPQVNINSSIENLEFNFISTIYRILNQNKPNIAFLKGNGELSNLQVKDVIESINEDNNNLSFYFNVDTFNIKKFELDSNKSIDLNSQLNRLNFYDGLIIAKPTIPFNNIDKFLIDQYIMNGGKVLWLINGVKADISMIRDNNEYFIAKRNNLNLDDQLFKYGVRINSDLIEDKRSTEIPIVTGYSNNAPVQEFFKWPYFPLLFSSNDHPITKSLDAIKCDFVSSIDTISNSINKTILLSSSENARVLKSPSKVSLSIIENPPPSETYNQSNIPISVLCEGKFESVFKNRIAPKNSSIKIINKSKYNKMIFISDGDLIANRVTKNNIYPLGYDSFINFTFEGNKKFIINCLQFLCGSEKIMSIKSKDLKLRLLDNKKINEWKNLIIIINLIIPILIILIFIVLYNNIFKKSYV